MSQQARGQARNLLSFLTTEDEDLMLTDEPTPQNRALQIHQPKPPPEPATLFPIVAGNFNTNATHNGAGDAVAPSFSSFASFYAPTAPSATAEASQATADVPSFSSFVKPVPSTDLVPVDAPPTTEQAVSDFLASFLFPTGPPTPRAHPSAKPKANKKKRPRPDDEHEEDSSSSSDDRKKRRKKEKRRLLAAKSVQDKVKMLELDLRNIKEDPREKEDLALATMSRDSAVIHKPFTSQAVARKDAFVQSTPWLVMPYGDKNNLQFGVHNPPLYYRTIFDRCVGLESWLKLKFQPDRKTFYVIDFRTSTDPNSSLKESRYAYNEYLKSSEGAIRARKSNAAISSDYIPLPTDKDMEMLESVAAASASTSLEERIIRRMKDFNERTKSEPTNVRLWLEFIKFQDEFAQLSASERKAATAATGTAAAKTQSTRAILEKKVSIFKTALETNPASLELLLGYLSCCEQLHDSDEVQRIWVDVVSSHPDLPSLWHSYMNFVQSNFSSFTMTQYRTSYSTALKTLDKQKKIYEGSATHSLMEERMLAIIIRAVHSEKQAGYTERAIAILQALIEFNLFMPTSFDKSPKPQKGRVKEPDATLEAKIAYFQAFWDAEVPRFGENGAQGWADWFEAATAKTKNAMEIIEDYDPLNPTESIEDQKKREEEAILQLERELKEAEDRALAESAQAAASAPRQRNSVLEAEAKKTFADKDAERRQVRDWLLQEDLNDSSKWAPIRSDQLTEDADIQRVVLFEDIRDCLLVFADKEIKKELVLSLFGLLGLPYLSDASTRASHHPLTIERSEMALEEIGDAFSLLDDVQYPEQCAEGGDESIRSAVDFVPGQAAAAQLESYGRLKQALERQAIDKSLNLVSNIPASATKQAFLRNCMHMAAVLFKDDKAFVQELQVSRLLIEGGITIQRFRPQFRSTQAGLSAANPVPAAQMKQARDFAMTLLKDDSLNLKLWRAYAAIEYSSGNLKEAQKVFDRALANAGKLPASVQANLPLLVRAYIDTELNISAATNGATNVQVLVSILLTLTEKSFSPKTARTQEVAPLRILKAKKQFEQLLASYKAEFAKLFAVAPAAAPNAPRNAATVLAQRAALAQGKAAVAQVNLSKEQRSLAEVIRDFFYCFAILELLSSNNDFSKVTKAFDQGLSLLGDGARKELAVFHEQLLEAKLKLLALDVLHPQSTSPPRLLRDALKKALQVYPTNKFVLSLLLYSERRSNVAGRIRRIFDDLLLAPKVNATAIHPQLAKSASIVWLYAVRAETKQGSAQRIKSLYERALQLGESTRLSPVLWKTYIDFEIKQGNPAAAKGVFFRAIRNVPWNKSMWLYCVRKLLKLMTSQELDEAIRLMTEKEIRLFSIPSV